MSRIPTLRLLIGCFAIGGLSASSLFGQQPGRPPAAARHQAENIGGGGGGPGLQHIPRWFEGHPDQGIFLPPAWGGTPLSFEIHAQANYLAAYGDMVESMANARKVNAEAVSLEIQNSIAAVDGYFKRRELNKEYRKSEMDWRLNERRRQEYLRSLVEEFYQKTANGGNKTLMLNWLLQRLSAPTLAYQYLPSGQTLTNSRLDQKLSREDLKQIRLTNGGGAVKTLVFAAADGEMLKADWPLALKEDEFKELRQKYENARAKVLQEASQRDAISYESAQDLRESVVALMFALEAAYPKDVRADHENPDTEKYVLYVTSKRYLQGLWGSAVRATTTKDLSVFSGRLKFEGDSLVALIQHMYGLGLQFAPPEPGGEGIYDKLFTGMRNLYVNIGNEKPETDIAKP